MTRGGAAIGARLLALSLTSLSLAAMPDAQEPPATQWRAFDGSWSASGQRQPIPTESGRPAAVAHLSGAVILSNGSGTVAGFTGEAISFDDGADVTTGRAVWTDSAGDRIYSALRGGPLQTGRRITGRITGGTGRWTGVMGEYELTWQYVVSAEGESLQGRAVDLRGRFRWREGTP
jgi:hypothetical protein